MKKIYSFIALAIMAIAASAQEPLYTISTKVSYYDGWGDSYAPYFAFQGTEVNVEVYEDNYIIVKNWAGAEGCDIKVEMDPNIVVDNDNHGNIISITNFINGDDVEPNTYSYNGLNYCEFYTEREDYGILSTTLNEDGTIYNCWLEYDKENKTGYLQFTGYFCSSDYSSYAPEYYYFIEWPYEEKKPQEWVNPFEGEAALLYSTVAKTGNEGDAWGISDFPVVENIKVDVYDKYIYIHALGGVEGYDIKVAHDENENVTSFVTINNGEESEPIRTSAYIYTGLADKYCLEAYTSNYSYAASYEDKSGYVTLGCYIYNADGSSTWSYYHISWEGDPQAINGITTNSIGEGTVYNLAGQQVTTNYKGIAIKNGKKVLVK